MITERPKLTLKKPALAPAVTPVPVPKPAAVPAKAPESSKKLKPIPNAEKELKKQKNIQHEAELSARKREQIEKLTPIVRAYFASKPIMAEIIEIDSVACLKPLAVGIHKTIIATLQAQPEFQDCSRTTLHQMLAKVLNGHTSRPEYLAGVLNFAQRYGIDGESNGEVTEKHKADASKRTGSVLPFGSSD